MPRHPPRFTVTRLRVVAAAAVLVLVPVASALASRAPTAAERRAITRVAKRTPSAQNKTVHVSRIRVSTVGPWARATITIFFGTAGGAATDVLHKVHGTWVNAGAGTAGEECVMPPKDRRDLGFGSYPCR